MAPQPSETLAQKVGLAKQQIVDAFNDTFRQEAVALLGGDFALAQELHAQLEQAVVELGPIAQSIITLTLPKPETSLQTTPDKKPRSSPSRPTESPPQITTPELLQKYPPIQQFLDHPPFWTTEDHGKPTLARFATLTVLITTTDGHPSPDHADPNTRTRLQSLLFGLRNAMPKEVKNDVTQSGTLLQLTYLHERLQKSKTYTLRTTPISDVEFAAAAPRKKKAARRPS